MSTVIGVAGEWQPGEDLSSPPPRSVGLTLDPQKHVPPEDANSPPCGSAPHCGVVTAYRVAKKSYDGSTAVLRRSREIHFGVFVIMVWRACQCCDHGRGQARWRLTAVTGRPDRGGKRGLFSCSTSGGEQGRGEAIKDRRTRPGRLRQGVKQSACPHLSSA